jgi:hypothetical protein
LEIIKRIAVRNLPAKIYLSDFGGDFSAYIDAVYEVFHNDFVSRKAHFGSHKLNLKFHPLFQERAYTFYHLTHKGEDEANRLPDMRRCECMPWARPAVGNCSDWKLKFWRQSRVTKKGQQHRICIWLDNGAEEVDYFVIVDVRESYILLWTAFVAEYSHEKAKKQKEFDAWVKTTGGKHHTPDGLVKEIMDELKKQGTSR